MKKNISFHVHYFPRVFLSVYFCFACQICAHARFFWKIKTNASCLYSYSYSLWQFSLNTLTRHIFKKLKQVPNSMKLRKEKEDNIASICSQLDQLFQKKKTGVGRFRTQLYLKKNCEILHYTLHIKKHYTSWKVQTISKVQQGNSKFPERFIFCRKHTIFFLPCRQTHLRNTNKQHE